MDQLPDVAVGFQEDDRYPFDQRVVENHIPRLPAERQIPLSDLLRGQGREIVLPRAGEFFAQRRGGVGRDILLLFERFQKGFDSRAERGERLGRLERAPLGDLLPEPVVLNRAPKRALGRISLDRVDDGADSVETLGAEPSRPGDPFGGRQARFQGQRRPGLGGGFRPRGPRVGGETGGGCAPGFAQTSEDLRFPPVGVRLNGRGRPARSARGEIGRFPVGRAFSRIERHQRVRVPRPERAAKERGGLFVEPEIGAASLDPPGKDFFAVKRRPVPERPGPLLRQFRSQRPARRLGAGKAAVHTDEKLDSAPRRGVGHFRQKLVADARAVFLAVRGLRGIFPADVPVLGHSEIVGAGRRDLIGDEFDPKLPLEPVGVGAVGEEREENADPALRRPRGALLSRNRRRDRGERREENGETEKPNYPHFCRLSGTGRNLFFSSILKRGAAPVKNAERPKERKKPPFRVRKGGAASALREADSYLNSSARSFLSVSISTSFLITFPSLPTRIRVGMVVIP